LEEDSISGKEPLPETNMTIDERLEKLTERHEAVTQTFALRK